MNIIMITYYCIALSHYITLTYRTLLYLVMNLLIYVGLAWIGLADFKITIRGAIYDRASHHIVMALI